MRLSILLLVVLAAGCREAPRQIDLQPFIAVAGNYALLAAKKDAPSPAPDSDECEACAGKGTTDGRVKCPVCDGTGRKPKADEPAPAAPVAAPAAAAPVLPAAPAATILDCKDGRCTTRVIVR